MNMPSDFAAAANDRADAAATKPATSLLAVAAPVRVLGAAVAVVLLWLAVAWALMGND